ncbi:Protein ELC-like [Linum perenne]
MMFQGVTYNIPVIIWLMDSYLCYPPCVYVNPTRDMIIKRPHAHVNPSGLVFLSYLQNWIYPSSNLLDLIRESSSVFGRDPPLYAQRRPISSPNPNHNHSNPSPSPSPTHQTDDVAKIYRRNAINKIVEMAHGDMSQLRKTREAEMEGLFNGQAVLRREEDANRGLKELQDEKEGLEAQLQVVLMNSDVLESWVRENERMVKGKLGEVDVDSAFECMDSLSKQMLECT